MKIGVVTLFPQMFDAITQYGVSSRACKHGLIEISYTNPRDFAYDKHQNVDEKPFGGGPGMLMMVQPLRDAILKAKQALPKAKVVYLSPQGKRFSNEAAVNFSALEEVIFVSGRYEGIDERIIETLIDEEWSIGDYELSGGELATMVMIDAIARFIPGVLGDSDSAQADSFAQGFLDYPQYTKPLEIDGLKVPDVLLSGNHELIRKWRLKEALGRTYERRPDLLNNLALTDAQEKLLAQYLKEHPQDATRKQ